MVLAGKSRQRYTDRTRHAGAAFTVSSFCMAKMKGRVTAREPPIAVQLPRAVEIPTTCQGKGDSRQRCKQGREKTLQIAKSAISRVDELIIGSI